MKFEYTYRTISYTRQFSHVWMCMLTYREFRLFVIKSITIETNRLNTTVLPLAAVELLPYDRLSSDAICATCNPSSDTQTHGQTNKFCQSKFLCFSSKQQTKSSGQQAWRIHAVMSHLECANAPPENIFIQNCLIAHKSKWHTKFTQFDLFAFLNAWLHAFLLRFCWHSPNGYLKTNIDLKSPWSSHSCSHRLSR